jgi:hypothetical protein
MAIASFSFFTLFVAVCMILSTKAAFLINIFCKKKLSMNVFHDFHFFQVYNVYLMFRNDLRCLGQESSISQVFKTSGRSNRKFFFHC